MKKSGLFVLALILLGCSHIDTGQIDYRVADAPAENTKARACPADLKVSCEGRRLSRVHRRYDPGPDFAAFTSSDIYSIEIEQGAIGSNILEGNILGQQMGHNAEIAILANVFEFAPANSTAAAAAARRFLEPGQFSGTDDPSDVELKLIYFSDDIERGQPFSFSNIPLRARSRYEGGSIGIQIVVMEVDAQSGPVASLMGTLARFGQQVVPGPTEVKDLLFDLGESLFTGAGSDDRLFEYRFVLSAPGATADSMQATFAPGRYVLRRWQERERRMEWGNVRLDHNTARLFRQSDGGAVQEITDELYLVLNIRRYDRSTQPEVYEHQAWPQFRRMVENAAAPNGGPIASVTQNLERMLVAHRSDQRRTDLTQQWGAAERRLRAFTSRAIKGLEDPALSGCAAQTTLLRGRRDMAEREARDAIREFVAGYQAALAPPAAVPGAPAPPAGAPSPEPEFALADREALVSVVARFFMPWATAEASRNFASAAAFQTAFIGAGDLAEVAIQTARDRGPMVASCEALASLGG